VIFGRCLGYLQSERGKTSESDSDESSASDGIGKLYGIAELQNSDKS
jgi:hypothetical protein